MNWFEKFEWIRRGSCSWAVSNYLTQTLDITQWQIEHYYFILYCTCTWFEKFEWIHQMKGFEKFEWLSGFILYMIRKCRMNTSIFQQKLDITQWWQSTGHYYYLVLVYYMYMIRKIRTNTSEEFIRKIRMKKWLCTSGGSGLWLFFSEMLLGLSFLRIP